MSELIFPPHAFIVCDYEDGVALEHRYDGALQTRLVFRDGYELLACLEEVRLMAGEFGSKASVPLTSDDADRETIETWHAKGLTIRSLCGAVVLKKKAGLRMYYAAGGLLTYLKLVHTDGGITLLLLHEDFLTDLISMPDTRQMSDFLRDLAEVAGRYNHEKDGTAVTVPIRREAP